MRQLQFSEHGRVAILAAEDIVIAHPTEVVVAANAELVKFSQLADAGVTKNPSYMTRSVSLTVPADAPWRVLAYAPESDFTAAMKRRVASSLVISAVALVVAMIIAWLLARRVSGPLTRLSAQMVRVGDLHLDDPPPRESVFREIDMMNTSLVKMTSGLRSFARYVPRDLVRTLLAHGEQAELRGQLRELTVFFSDLAGFTSLAETRRPDELVQFLSEYFDDMSKIIANEGGTVDKYIGDGIMAFWGAPVPLEQHAKHACIAALRCQQRVRELAKGGATLTTRIGLATGEVLVGNIGSTERLNYTVMGDTANLASRLEGLNKQYGTDLLISEKTYEEGKEAIVARPIDVVAVKGKKEGVRVYELLALRSDANADAEAVAESSARALTSYLARDFASAIVAWNDVLAKRPGDKAATTMRDRAQTFVAAPPPPDWAGVMVATEK
jgi:adenylate cyclase